MKNADLHTHSSYSCDSKITPRELIKRAKKAGLKYIALTDHDSIEGIPEALKAGKKLNVTVIRGLSFIRNMGKYWVCS